MCYDIKLWYRSLQCLRSSRLIIAPSVILNRAGEWGGICRHARFARGDRLHIGGHELWPVKGVPKSLRLRLLHNGQGTRPPVHGNLERSREGSPSLTLNPVELFLPLQRQQYHFPSTNINHQNLLWPFWLSLINNDFFTSSCYRFPLFAAVICRSILLCRMCFGPLYTTTTRHVCRVTLFF